MKRKIVIIISLILVLIMLSLYYTYATNVTMEQTSGNADLTFNINITDTTARSITVQAGKTKYFDIFITNKNDATINYGLAYNNVKTDGITVAQLNSSKNGASDLIDSNITYQISLIIKNDTQSNITYDIVPIVGYLNGGDLIVPSNYTLITDVYNSKTNSIFGTVSDWININGSGSVLGPEGTGNNNLDASEANSPDLVEGLVPITYSNNKWVKADSNNTDNSWYNYDNKQWANAVLVTSDYRDSNNKDTFNVGDEVPEEAILAYYVWIPRYKYKVWNITKIIGTDSYDAQNRGIDIRWESETNTTGTIRCNYDFSVLEGEELSETCSGANGEYYTHPAFTFGNAALRGFWVGKFEISSSNPEADYGGGTTTVLTARIKPYANSWRYNTVTNFSLVIQNMSLDNNEYGLTAETDSHMLKNSEWGAIAYLTNSKYGRCSDGVCTEISLNSYYGGSGATGLKTGCGPQNETSIAYGSTCNEYNSELGQLSSTTGNVYGIYDMSGGAYEYVMGNVSGAGGSYTYNASSAGSSFSYSTTTSKYVNTYAYGTSNNNQTAYNRARLGDGIGEVVVSSGIAWYGDSASFPKTSAPWFVRGGYCASETSGGVFLFVTESGDSRVYDSTRAILVSTS